MGYSGTVASYMSMSVQGVHCWRSATLFDQSLHWNCLFKTGHFFSLSVGLSFVSIVWPKLNMSVAGFGSWLTFSTFVLSFGLLELEWPLASMGSCLVSC